MPVPPPEPQMPPLDSAIKQAERINPGSSPYQPGAAEAMKDIKSLVVEEEKLASLKGLDLTDNTVRAIARSEQLHAIATMEREINNINYRHPNDGPHADAGANEVIGNTRAALTQAETSLKALDQQFDIGTLQKAINDIDVAAQNYKFVATGDLVMASERAVSWSHSADPSTRAVGNQAIASAYDFVGQGQAANNLFRDMRADLGCDNQREAVARDFNFAIERIIGVSKDGITGGQNVTDSPSSSSSCPIANMCAGVPRGK